MMTTSRNLSVVVRPARDIPGLWIAHCLEVDVISQGESIRDAMDNLLEAFSIVFEDEIEAGCDPFQHQAAPEDFELYEKIRSTGRPATSLDDPALARDGVLIATQIHYQVVPVRMPARGYVPVPAPAHRAEPVPFGYYEGSADLAACY